MFLARFLSHDYLMHKPGLNSEATASKTFSKYKFRVLLPS